MAISGKETRGLVEELRTLRTRLDKLERRNAELVRAEQELRQTQGALQAQIDGRRRMEEELKIRDRAIASSATAIAIAEFAGNVTYVNDAFLKMWGFDDRSEVLGKPAVEFWDVKDHALDIIKRLRDGNGVAGELVGKRRDGSLFSVELSASAVTDAGGTPVYMMASFVDVTDRTKARETLREREATLMGVFRAAPVGIGLERDRVLVCVNDMICEMLGYGRDELIGRHAEMFYPSRDDYQRARDVKHRQISEKGKATIETRWKRKDGRILDVLLSATVFDPADFSKGVTFTALDITERKSAEEAIRESEEKFRSLADQSPNMIFINKNGKIVYANKKCEEIMGYTREELYRADFDFRTLIAPESAGLVKESFARHSWGRDVEPYDLCLLNKMGQRIEAINTSKLIQYEGQTAILGIVTDITQRKKTERELRESQERLKVLFESAPDAIYLTDLEGRFVDGNRAAEDLVGFKKAELIGKSLAESGLLNAEDLSKAAANLEKVAAGKPSGPTEYLLKRKDGRLIGIEVRTFPVRIGGKMLSLGIARDVTARKRAQQKLLDDREKLKSLASQLSLTEERERHRLATELHDHISQSLVISKIKLDQLRGSQAAGEMAGAIEDVSRCLGQVIQNTRTLTFDLSYPILYELGFEAAVAEWLTEEIQEKHGIETGFQDDGQVKPLDDDIRALLFRNVRELLINVVKHAKAHHVKVCIRKADKHISVNVEDDGMGFDPVEVGATAAKKAEFGLFSIRERLEQLGGRIEIESKPGCGTKITMTAPLKYEPADGGAPR
jgi:PAS domain S-box-containing protein